MYAVVVLPIDNCLSFRITKVCMHVDLDWIGWLDLERGTIDNACSTRGHRFSTDQDREELFNYGLDSQFRYKNGDKIVVLRDEEYL